LEEGFYINYSIGKITIIKKLNIIFKSLNHNSIDLFQHLRVGFLNADHVSNYAFFADSYIIYGAKLA